MNFKFICLVLFVIKLATISSFQFYNEILSQKDIFLINPINLKCDDHKQSILFVSFIVSAVSNFEQRNAIRTTWAGPNEHARFFFLLGKSQDNNLNEIIYEENKQHGDILQANFLDTYRNLTLKTLFGLKWISLYCSNAKFIMKVDDDMVLNMKWIVKYFSSQTNANKTMYGLVKEETKPFREKESKFYVTKEEYEKEFYPKYCLGAFYLLTIDLVEPMLNLTSHVKPFVFEDVYVGMLANRIEVSFKNFANYWMYKQSIDSFDVFGVQTSTKRDFFYVWDKLKKNEIYFNEFSFF